MSKITFLAVAAALIGAGEGLANFANGAEDPNDPNPAPTPPTGDGEAPTKRRGRPPGAASKPAEQETPAAPAEDDAARFERNRGLIKPLVENQQGEELKKVIAKYSKDGLKNLPSEHQAAFEKDVAALSY